MSEFELDRDYKSLMLVSVIDVLKKTNLKKAKIDPVIKRYFNDAVELFEEMHRSSVAWEEKKEPGDISLEAKYLIPEVQRLFHENKAKILPWVFSGTNGEDVRFFKTMHSLLDDFNNKKKITRKQKHLLNFFFKKWQIEVDSVARSNRFECDEFHFAFAN